MPFVKGDPRINRNGRPKSFDELRALALKLLREDVDGKAQVEIILRKILVDNPTKLIEYGYGKVPDELLTDGEVRIIVEYAGERDAEPNDTTTATTS